MIFRLLLIAFLIFGTVYGLLYVSFYKGFVTRARLKTVNRVVTVGVFAIIISVIVFSIINSTQI